jgi:predicted ATPase/transcriptional regulator with XRE-family HTH domain
MTGTATTSSPSFGDLLRRYRERASLSQEELAERAGVTSQAISNLERGERRHPYPATVRRLAGALGLPEEERSALLAAVPARRQPGPEAASAELRGPSAPGGDQPRAASGVPALPAPLTPLVGREDDVARVTELLLQDGARLLTLTGPGGVGKTRLTLEIAAEMRRHFPDGVAFVSLSPLANPGLVLPTVAQVLGVRESGGVPPAEQLVRALQGRRLLLVLDNCEHVLEGVSGIAGVLEACPQLVVLATSRASLRLQGEQEYPVSPLALPPFDHAPTLGEAEAAPAVRLFVERAQAARSGFALSPEIVSAVAAICARLDGLPLALELAAPWVKLLPPPALLDRLHHGLPLLTGGGRDLPDRQQTLRATIDWSYGLLEEPERALFRRLSVFAGGCTLEAAEAVTGAAAPAEIDILATLGSLVDQSLVQMTEVEGEGRLSLLETIREFAAEQLAEQEEEAAIRAAHAAYFLALAEDAARQAEGPRQIAVFQRLETEHDNLRAALSWARKQSETELGLRLAGALGRFWEVRSHVSEGRTWLAAALAAGTAPAQLRAAALDAAGRLAYYQGDVGQAEKLDQEALALWRALEDRAGIAASLNSLGTLANRQGDIGRAVALHEEALALWRELGDRHGIALSVINLGGLAYWQGDFGRSRALHEEALALRRELGDQRGIALALINLGALLCWQGDLDRAVTVLEEALPLARELEDPALCAMSEICLGHSASRGGDLSAAASHYQEALRLGRDTGDRYLLPYALEGWGWATRDQDEGERAAQLYGAAAALRAVTQVVVAPYEAADREQKIAALRQSLGATAFECEWATGERMLPEEAVVLALEEAGMHTQDTEI